MTIAAKPTTTTRRPSAAKQSPARAARKETLAGINRRLFRDPKKLLKAAEEKTRRLTGQSRL